MSDPTGLTQIANAVNSNAPTDEINQNCKPGDRFYLYVDKEDPNAYNVGIGCVKLRNAAGEEFILSDALYYEPDTLKYRIIRRIRHFISYIRELCTVCTGL